MNHFPWATYLPLDVLWLPGFTTNAERGQPGMAMPRGRLLGQTHESGPLLSHQSSTELGLGLLQAAAPTITPGHGPGPTQLPTGWCSALSIIPMTPLGYPRSGTDPGCFLLTVQLPCYTPSQAFLRLKDTTQNWFWINREKKYRIFDQAHCIQSHFLYISFKIYYKIYFFLMELWLLGL